jgi:selenide,water dikinase
VSGINPPETRAIQKTSGQVGDVLVLTKPLGTGIVMEMHMRLLAKAISVKAALDCMLVSNQAASHVLRETGATSLTDVTGFGLVGCY